MKAKMASKRFAELHEQALGVGLRLEVLLVPDNIEDGDTIEYHKFGIEQAGPSLPTALGKIEAFLNLPSVVAIGEALAERKVIVGQLEALSQQADEVLANLAGVEVSIATLEEEAVLAAASLAASK